MMNEKIKTAFEKLIGQTPTDEEVAALYRTQQVLELNNDDPIWLILIALQYYLRLYNDIPKSIIEAQESALKTVTQTADLIIENNIAQAQKEMVNVVEKTAREVAYNISRKQMAQWIAVAVISVAGAVGGVSFYINNTAFNTGYSAGIAEGHTRSVDQKAAVHWANTSQGQWAKWMMQNGIFADIASCRLPGWKKKEGRCFPYADKEGTVYGWRIPPQYKENDVGD